MRLINTDNTSSIHFILWSAAHIINEVPDVSGVRQTGSDRVLRLSDHRPLVHPAHPRRLVDDVVQGLGLLQLAQVVVLHGGQGGKAASARWGGGGLSPSSSSLSKYQLFQTSFSNSTRLRALSHRPGLVRTLGPNQNRCERCLGPTWTRIHFIHLLSTVDCTHRPSTCHVPVI